MMQKLQRLSLPRRMLAYAAAVAVVLAVAAGFGVLVAFALGPDEVALQAGSTETITGVVVVVLLIVVAALAPLFVTLQRSRRMLRDQRERVQLLREERLMLVEELKQEVRERRALMDTLGAEGPQPGEILEPGQERHPQESAPRSAEQRERLQLEQTLRDLRAELDRERQEHLEVRRRAEKLEREHEQRSTINKEMEQLEQERQRLTEDLEEERSRRAEVQHRADWSDHERARLAEDLQQLRAELEEQKRAPHPERVGGSEATTLWGVWKRRRALIAGLLFGTLVAWFVSLVVALSLLTS